MQIELRQISKRFGRFEALKGIDLTVASGTIHGIVGENGAGKSTLMKILTGYLGRSAGHILLDGREVACDSPASAAREGIGMLYQEPQDFPPLTVLDNFIVGRDGPGDANRARQRRRLRELADRVHFHLDPDAPLQQLTVGERQQLEFLRLLGREARVLILDEPTTGISDRQKGLLFEALRRIRDDGRTILLVSHKLEDVEALCDRVTVLRQGRVSGEESAPFHLPRLLQLMFEAPEGTAPPAAVPTRSRRHRPGEPILRFDRVSAPGERTGLHHCSLTIHRGEVVGLAGLSGSGQGLFLRLAAALIDAREGEVRFHGRRLGSDDHRAFRRSGGSFLPADRLEEGLIPGFTIQDHFALADGIPARRARQRARQAIERFDIRGRPDTPAEALSGGNQQRLLLSLIPEQADLILLENPSRGLDVASAEWVWGHLRGQYAQRGAIVFSSAELDEILAIADRVLVFHEGRVVRDLSGDAIDYHQVAAAMTGH
ncbi:MAG TPA: ATP-binding cassette domain-containing protein [Sedimenticola thiotaurini]|uniref:ATP-binding cassette domain-containing protein n=1 Tax=Sedimenticola thiotaurini TaxID=1543721 RepID=A0A831RPG7_9GAMM|nr:ATP-binding cassette domain-containing protein [Sedimenticola thiotaurini]